jgi:NAD(P)-dependent dehydrogenase (short-subunit alcohol dehydrogenase family)
VILKIALFDETDRSVSMDDNTTIRESRPGVSLIAATGLLAAATAGAMYAARRQRCADFAGRNVLIAGASRGLGLELAREFFKAGANLMLVARDGDQLAAVKKEMENTARQVTTTTRDATAGSNQAEAGQTPAGAQVLTATCDITNELEVRATVTRLISEIGRVDVLVNVAGVIQVGPAEHMKTEDFEAALKVHYWGPLYLMQAVIPLMRNQRWGRIVNIASIGGKIAVPHLAPYVASKFALVGLSQAMRAELVKDGIYVTTVCPGLMRTGSHINALFKGQQRKEFALFSIVNASPLLSTSSTTAARQIVEACRYGTAEIVITPQARLARLVNCLLPNFTMEVMSLIARILPGPSGAEGDQLKRGWESRSLVAPSFLTQAADRASTQNNEKPKPAA